MVKWSERMINVVWREGLPQKELFFGNLTVSKPVSLDVIMPNKSSIPAVREEVRKRNQKFFLLCRALSAARLFHG